MASILDTSTTLKTMSDANEDIVTLITNLKNLIDGSEPVEFQMGDYTITVDSITKLIDAYRNGRFETLLIGSQSTDGKQVKLSVNSEGELQVTDVSGNLVPVSCSKLNHSYIVNSTANKVSAYNCNINSVKGSVSISGGRCNLSSFSVSKKMTADSIQGSTINASTLNVTNNLSCSSILSYGTRRLNIKTVRNVFYDGSTILNNFANILNDAISYGTWDMSATNGSPRDLGFSTTVQEIPGMIKLQGVNSYGSLEGFHPYNIRVSYNGTILNISDVSSLGFPALMLWPYGYIDTTNNQLVLKPFDSKYAGRDIYYCTGGEQWAIYRTLAVSSGVVTFGNPYVIPPYSCIRFVMTARSDANSSMSVLEIA